MDCVCVIGIALQGKRVHCQYIPLFPSPLSPLPSPSFLLLVHGSVKTNMSRPLSKPRVRNPLTSLKPQHQDSPQHRHSPQRDSPTQIEREFLASSATAGWGETWEEEEFYRAIPDDTTHLDSSLSSSLTSLCATSRDTATARAGEV